MDSILVKDLYKSLGIQEKSKDAGNLLPIIWYNTYNMMYNDQSADECGVKLCLKIS